MQRDKNAQQLFELYDQMQTIINTLNRLPTLDSDSLTLAKNARMETQFNIDNKLYKGAVDFHEKWAGNAQSLGHIGMASRAEVERYITLHKEALAALQAVSQQSTDLNSSIQSVIDNLPNYAAQLVEAYNHLRDMLEIQIDLGMSRPSKDETFDLVRHFTQAFEQSNTFQNMKLIENQVKPAIKEYVAHTKYLEKKIDQLSAAPQPDEEKLQSYKDSLERGKVQIIQLKEIAKDTTKPHKEIKKDLLRVRHQLHKDAEKAPKDTALAKFLHVMTQIFTLGIAGQKNKYKAKHFNQHMNRFFQRKDEARDNEKRNDHRYNTPKP